MSVALNTQLRLASMRNLYVSIIILYIYLQAQTNMSPKFEQTPRTSQKGGAIFYMSLNIWIRICIIVSTKRVLLLYYSGAAETENRAPQWSSASRPQRHGQVGG